MIAPGGGIALGNGTKVMSEPVDPLRITVPEGWQGIDVDPTKLPDELRGLAAQAPTLTGVLLSHALAAADGGVRLVAYGRSPQFTFLSIRSFASPGEVRTDEAAVAAGEAAVAAADAQAKALQTGTERVHIVHLPAGSAVQIDLSVPAGTLYVVAQQDTVVTADRTVEIQVAAQSDTATPPPSFAQMLESLRVG